MANYNGARYLRRQLQSLLRQTLTSWELILVDDASSDESVAVAEQTANGILAFTSSANGQQRSGAARNRALDAARGQWIAVFDSDDLMVRRDYSCCFSGARNDEATIVADNPCFSPTPIPDSKPAATLRRLGRSRTG